MNQPDLKFAGGHLCGDSRSLARLLAVVLLAEAVHHNDATYALAERLVDAGLRVAVQTDS